MKAATPGNCCSALPRWFAPAPTSSWFARTTKRRTQTIESGRRGVSGKVPHSPSTLSRAFSCWNRLPCRRQRIKAVWQSPPAGTAPRRVRRECRRPFASHSSLQPSALPGLVHAQREDLAGVDDGGGNLFHGRALTHCLFADQVVGLAFGHVVRLHKHGLGFGELPHAE